ncbi:hypothetical protein FACS189494_01570 [Spirochaetia bacterium]|nr:hypothetical protein FACS189494_01570 [Spirochaetia bacterium]
MCQLCHDVPAYERWVKKCRKAGMEYTVKQIWRYMNTDLQGIHLYALNKAEKVAKIILNSGILQQSPEK